MKVEVRGERRIRQFDKTEDSKGRERGERVKNGQMERKDSTHIIAVNRWSLVLATVLDVFLTAWGLRWYLHQLVCVRVFVFSCVHVCV